MLEEARNFNRDEVRLQVYSNNYRNTSLTSISQIIIYKITTNTYICTDNHTTTANSKYFKFRRIR